MRLSTLVFVDALKSVTYAFMLGQKVAHQSTDALLDAVLTFATTVTLPELVLLCLEVCSCSVALPSCSAWGALLSAVLYGMPACLADMQQQGIMQRAVCCATDRNSAL